MIVDAHVHVFTSAEASARRSDELAPPRRTATIEEFAIVRRSNGVRRAVLVPLDATDDYAPATARADPDSYGLVGVLGARHELPPGQLEGLDALRIQWLGEPQMPLTESPRFAILAEAARYRIVLWAYLIPGQLSLVRELVRALPDTRIVLNHLGFAPHDMKVDAHQRPAFDDALPEVVQREILALADLRQVNILFSGHYALASDPYPYESLRPFSQQIAERFGADRMLWGSDYPWIVDTPGYQQTIEIVSHQLPGASASERDAIYSGTALRLFPRLKGD